MIGINMLCKDELLDHDDFNNARALARTVGVYEPESLTSYGANYLVRIRDEYLDQRDEIADADEPSGDRLSDLADTLIPPGTHLQWEIFLDLQLYSYDSEFIYDREKHSYGDNREDVLSARKFMDDGPTVLLYEVASRLLYTLAYADGIS